MVYLLDGNGGVGGLSVVGAVRLFAGGGAMGLKLRWG